MGLSNSPKKLEDCIFLNYREIDPQSYCEEMLANNYKRFQRDIGALAIIVISCSLAVIASGLFYFGIALIQVKKIINQITII